VGSKIVIAILPEGILEIGSEKHKCLAGVWLKGWIGIQGYGLGD
jgi:hypothetical protein